jgi:protein-disulfide isomerase
MKLYLTGAAALALMLGGCGKDGDSAANGSAGNAALTQIAAPNGDWTQTVTETPEGGVRMGNPDAPVKLVEYGSLSCSHCAAFSETGSEPLTNTYVKSGQVSWEFRPFLLFPTDPGVTMLLKCHGPTAFFRLAEQLYADQPNWIAKLRDLPPAQAEQVGALPAQERAAAYVRLAGLDQFFRQRGMPEAKINACLADPQGLQRLVDRTQQAAQKEGVSATPTFFINGRAAEAGEWDALEPRLRAALQ